MIIKRSYEMHELFIIIIRNRLQNILILSDSLKKRENTKTCKSVKSVKITYLMRFIKLISFFFFFF